MEKLTVADWFGFEKREFWAGERAALLVAPKIMAAGQPWIWRPEFFGHEPQADLALLEKGFHVAYLNVQNLFGAPVALDAMDEFYGVLVALGLSPKPVLEGFSRGGLFALNWAARNPQNVMAIYLDAPVCDFKSWPGGKGNGEFSPQCWQECKNAYNLSEEAALAYQFNPNDNLAPLVETKIPILGVYGMADTAVRPDENIELLAARYRALGGPIELIPKPGVGHHPHSLEDPTPIVEFVLRHHPR